MDLSQIDAILAQSESQDKLVSEQQRLKLHEVFRQSLQELDQNPTEVVREIFRQRLDAAASQPTPEPKSGFTPEMLEHLKQEFERQATERVARRLKEVPRNR